MTPRPYILSGSSRLALVAVLVLAPGVALSVLSPVNAYASGGTSGSTSSGTSGSGSSSGQGGGDQGGGALADAAATASQVAAADAAAAAAVAREAADDRADALARAAEHKAAASRIPAGVQPEPEHRIAPAPAPVWTAGSPAAVAPAVVSPAGVAPAVDAPAGTPEPALAGTRSPQVERPSAGYTAPEAAAAADPVRLVTPPATLSTAVAVPSAEVRLIARASLPLIGTTLGEMSPAALGRATALAGAGLLVLLGLYGAALQASRSLLRPPE